MHPQQAYQLCRRYKYRYVRITTTDGMVYDGFISDVDSYNVTLAIPTCEMEDELRGESSSGDVDFRHVQFFRRRRGRRFFRRVILPLFIISALFPRRFF